MFSVKGVPGFTFPYPVEYLFTGAILVGIASVIVVGVVIITVESTVPHIKKSIKQKMRQYQINHEGDTVTLTVDIDNEKEFAEAHGGYIPKALSKEYTVKGLYKYITSPDDIPDGVLEYYDTCIKEAFNEKAEELNKIHDNDSSGNYIGYYNIEYVSNFVCTPKDSGSNWHNEWHLVYKINAEGGYASYLLGGTSGSFYMDIDFPEVSISDESDYFAGMTSLEGIFYTAINDCIEADAKTDFDLTLSSYAITNIYTPGTKIYSRVYKSLDGIKENYNEIENYNCVYDF